MNDTTILVTGASGFVGSHIAIGLAKAKYSVVGLGGNNPCCEEVISSGVIPRQVDLTKQDEVESLLVDVKPDVVVHAAALARADVCENNPALAHRSNVLATENLLKLSSNKLFLHISTDLVFDAGVAPKGGFAEGDRPNARSVYGLTKAQAEDVVLEQSDNSFVLRSCLVYGRKVGQLAGFLSWLRDGLEQQKEVTLFVDEYRTPIFTEDIVDCLKFLVSKHLKTKPGSDRVLHLSGGERISRYDFGLKYAEVFGFNSSCLKPTKLSDVQMKVHRSPDVSLLSKVLSEVYNWHPTSILDALQELRE